MTNETACVLRAKRGDREAFGALVCRYQKMAVGYAYSVLLDFDLAQDAAQEAFLQVYVDLAKLDDPGAFAPWLRRIVFSRCTRHLRGRRFTTVPLDSIVEMPEIADSPQRAMERRETQQVVRAAIGTLPEAERTTVTLFYMGGYSHKEIGAFLNAPVSTVKSRLHEARGKLRERMVGMMEQTLQQNAPGEAFRQTVREKVEKLAWETSGDCTFAGALAAATGVTPFPYGYQYILGVTGLAFRTRWYTGPMGEKRWCPSSPVGEFPEEIEAARRGTGWALREEREERGAMARLAPDIVRAVDAGLPPLAYDDNLNSGVVCGYEDAGRTVLMRDYGGGEKISRRATADLKIIALFLDAHNDAISPRDAAVQGISLGVRNWHRRHDPAGDEVRGYWYGRLALTRWADDIGAFDTLSEEERGFLCFVSWWNFAALADARRHAGPFLRQVTPLLHQAARPALERAAGLYDREADLLSRSFVHRDAFLGPWTGKSLNDWTDEVRRREQSLLTGARDLEANAIAALEEALATETEDSSRR